MAINITMIGTNESYTNYSTEPETGERTGPGVSAVACHKIPDIAILDQKRSLIDLNIVRTHFINGGRLSLKQAAKIIADAERILRKEPNVVRVDRKCFIVGDIHGQFYDLLSILSNFDLARDTLIFLGDYVDRGRFSTETYLYLLLLKTHYPESIILLRGNHESKKMTNYFTFRTECLSKYDGASYELFVRSFMTLPLAAVVQERAFCCHGGISPNLIYISDIEKINRFVEVDYRGLLCDIMWSDPHYAYRTDHGHWVENDKRRCSFYYNFLQVRRFLDNNGLSTIIRGHEVQEGIRDLRRSQRGPEPRHDLQRAKLL